MGAGGGGRTLLVSMIIFHASYKNMEPSIMYVHPFCIGGMSPLMWSVCIGVVPSHNLWGIRTYWRDPFSQPLWHTYVLA